MMDVIWKHIPGAIYSNTVQSKLNVAGFKSSFGLDEIVELNGLFESVDFVDSGSEISLREGEQSIALEIKLKEGTLNTIDLDLFDLNHVKMDTSFIVNVVLKNENGNISFKNASLQNLKMNASLQNVDSVQIGGFDAYLQGGNFSLNVSILNNNGRLKVERCESVLSYSKLDLKSNGSTVLTESDVKKFTYSYLESKWNLPEEISNMVSLFSGDSFSVNTLVKNAGNVPFLQNVDLTIGNASTSVQNFASKVDALRNDISQAIAKNIKQSGGSSYTINVKSLQSDFSKATASKLDNLFSSIELGLVGSSSFNLLETPADDSVISLSKDQCIFNIVFKLKQASLTNLDVHGSTLASATVDSEISINVAMQVDAYGVKFKGASLDDLSFTIKPVGSVDNLPFTIGSNGIEISLVSGKWADTGISFSVLEAVDFAKAVTALNSTNILKNGNLKIGGSSASVQGLFNKISDVWDNVSMAFTSAFDSDSFSLDTGVMNNTLNRLVAGSKNSIVTWLSGVSIAGGNIDISDASFNGVDVWGENSNSGEKLTGGVYTIVFDLQTAYLDKLNIHSQELSNLGVNASIAVNISVTKTPGEGTDPVESIEYSVDFGSALFDINLRNAISADLPFTLSGNNAKVSWNNNVWTEIVPEVILKDNLSLENSISSISKTEISGIGKLDDLSAVSTSVNECWVCLTEALHNVLAKNTSGSFSMAELRTAFSNVLVAKGVSADFESINLVAMKYGEDVEDIEDGEEPLEPVENTYDLLDDTESSSIKIGEDKNKSLSFVFNKKDVSLNNLSIGGITVGAVSAENEFCLSVGLNVNGNRVSLKNASFDSLELKVNHTADASNTINVSIEDGFNATLKGTTLSLSAFYDKYGWIIKNCDLDYTSLDVVYGGQTLISNGKSDTLVYNNGTWEYSSDINGLKSSLDAETFSLKKTLNIDKNFKIPYITDNSEGTLKIGDDENTVEQIVEKVDDIRTNIMLALLGNITESGPNYQLDVVNAKKIVDELNSSTSVDVSTFFSSIDINGENFLDVVDTSTPITISADTFDIKFKLNTGKRNIQLVSGANSVDTDVNADITINIEIVKNGDKISLKSSFESFVLDLPSVTNTSANSADTPYKISDSDGHLKIYIFNGLAQANLELDSNIDDIYLPFGNDLDFFDNINIPFLENKDFSINGFGTANIRAIVDAINDYNRIAQYGIDEVIDDNNNIDLSEVHNRLSGIISKKIPLDKVSFYNANIDDESINSYNDSNYVNLLDGNDCNGKNLTLQEGMNVLVFKITPKDISLDKQLDLRLLKIGNFNVEFNAYVKLVLYVTQNGWIIFDDCYLDKISIELSSDVNASIDLGGLFKAEFKDQNGKPGCGKLSFSIDIDPRKDSFSEIFGDKIIKLTYEKLDLISGGLTIMPLEADDGFFAYNFDTEEWTLPNKIQRFASFSGDNLITQVHTVLNTMQTVLRSLVEKNTKLDFLDNSIENVLSIVEKVEHVVYGDGKTGDGTNLYGLCKCVDGQYQPNFSDLDEFAKRFNNAWSCFVCDVDPKTLSEDDIKKLKYCSVVYLNENKDPVEFDENKKVKNNDEVRYAKLSFELGFGIEKSFGLNFAKTLGEKFANISTCGSVKVGADASIIFGMLVDFKSSDLKKDSKLEDINLFKHDNEKYDKQKDSDDKKYIDVTVDEYYTVFSVGSKQFDKDLYIKLVKNDKTLLDTITIKAKNSLKTNDSAWYDKKETSINIDYTSDKCLYITATEKFDIENGTPAREDQHGNKLSSGGDAFAELKLTGSNLQTMYKVELDLSVWSLNFVEDNERNIAENGKVKSNVKIDSTIAIYYDNIKKLVEEGIILEKKDVKAQINEYLSLQKNGDFVPLPSNIEEGRSIMNTFGLYVVDVINQEGVLNVVFACDSRRIQMNGDDKKRYLLCEANEKNASNVVYMRLSSEIVPSMNTSGLAGALVYDSTSSKTYYVGFDRYKEYDDTEFNSLSLPNDIKNKVQFVKDSKSNLVSLKCVDGQTGYEIKVTDNILRITIGEGSNEKEYYINVDNCLTISNLAETIEKANIDSNIKSVTVVNGKLVFVTEQKAVIKLTDFDIDQNVNEINKDFKIGGVEVNFQECINNFTDQTTIEKLLEKINNKLNSAGLEIRLPVNSQTLIDKSLNEDEKYSGDHFEIVRVDGKKDSFTIESIGASKALEWLGFTSGLESKLVGADMKIVGTSVVNFDWAKAISLEDITLKADLSLDIGEKVQIESVSSPKSGRVTINIKDDDKNIYNVDGLLRLGEDNNAKYYRILKVNVDSEENRISSIEVSTYPYNGNEELENASKRETWENAVYVASASASLGFLGVDVIAEGNAKLTATFTLEKINEEKNESSGEQGDSGLPANPDSSAGTDVSTTVEDKNTIDLFGFKITPEIGFKDSTNKFSLKSYADVFGESVELATGSIGVVISDGAYSLKTDGGFKEDAIDNILGKLKGFSIEKLFAVLETLIQRIDEITANTENVKIPVINKSVRDLVNVANDLRDIIARLRADRVTTVQKFGNLLNDYLEELGLVSTDPDGKRKLFEMKPVYIDGKLNSLEFSFDIKKLFQTRHRFSFGSGSSGVNGNIDLDVTGDFWFRLTTKIGLNEKNEFCLKFVRDNNHTGAIEFGAGIAIAGDKMRFDLGINAGDNNLLSNLISVGSNENEAFLYGKVGFIGSVGKKDSTSTEYSLSELDDFDYKVPVAIYGKLPVYACNMSLGDVLIGKYMNNDVVFNSNGVSYESVANSIETAMQEYLDDSSKSDSLYVLASSEGSDDFDFQLRTKKSDGINNGKFVVDFSDAYEKITQLANFKNLDWFTKIKLAVAGLNNLFEMLESTMNSNMGSKIKSVPVVGSALSTGVDFLSVLRDKVLEPFSKYVYESTGLTAEMIAKKMNALLDGYFLETNNDDDNYTFTWDKTGDGDNGWQRTSESASSGKGTWFRTTEDSAEWFFNLGHTYSYGKSIDFDLGFPGLGLSSDAGLDLSLSWALEFGFGISSKDGFYFIFGDGNEISVKANASLDGTIIGSLAGLGMSLNTSESSGHNADIDLFFGVDLNKVNKTEDESKIVGKAESSTKKWEVDLSTKPVNPESAEPAESAEPTKYAYRRIALSEAFAKPEFDYGAKVDIYAGITVGIVKDLDRNTPKFPNITGDFTFKWGYGDFGTEEKESKVSALGFTNLQLDMGSFISGVLGPIVAKIQKVVEPLEPLIDFLTTPFPVLKDLGIKMTPLDLAKKYSKGRFDDSMVYAIKDLIAISKTISTVKGSGLTIDLGSFNLIGNVNSNPEMSDDEKETLKQNNSNAKNFLEGKSTTSSVNVNSYSDKLKDDKGGDITTDAEKEMKKQGFHMEEGGGWDFVWSHPSDIFKLLLGEDIDLVKYTMPKLSFNFDWSQFIRIWGPLGARIGVTFSASIQLSFGYDTLGIRQWVKGGYKDFSRLLNGFYVADKDETGTDINELSFYGGLTASAEVNVGVSAGVGGGVGIDVGFNLYDPNQDGKVRLSEMKQIIVEDGLFGLFDVNGKITAKLYAYVDLLFYTKKWNITDDITLFEFNFEHSSNPVMASVNENGDVVGHVGPNAGDRISTNDSNPTLTDGDENITLYVEGKDVSWTGGKNSVKVGDDGRILIDGGAGIDHITVIGNASCDLEIKGGDGNDVIDLSQLTVKKGYAVIVWGGSGNDHIQGAHGLNILFGDSGYARIEKEEKDQYRRKFVIFDDLNADVSGDDTIIANIKETSDDAVDRYFISGGLGNDQIKGSSGNDVIFGDGGKIEFDVEGKNGTANDLNEKEHATTFELGYITEVDIKEKLLAENKTIAISRTDINADGGNDLILGGAGNDIIYGGAGNDDVDGGADKDTIYGERGHDIILGGSGDDEIHGGIGHDIIFGDTIESSVNVGDLFDPSYFSKEFNGVYFDNKTLFENGSTSISREQFFNVKINDESDSSSGDDGLAGVDTIYGDEGDDLIFGDNGIENSVSDKGDIIEGGIGNDVIDGNGGNDTLNGGIDNDIIYGGSGDDIIDGGAGNDSLYGDSGVRYYRAGDLGVFEGKPITFGENLGLSNQIYKNAITDQLTGGNDKITTGPGMDFVDGQGGSDRFIVNLMGESETNYSNITDSGTGEFDKDTLTIEGTEYNDRLLMRRNSKGSLGFVTLLLDEQLIKGEIGNENIERVNFTSSIDVVNLNGNGGDDIITIDGTADMTNVDGGAGDDSFQIGQMYNSERVSGGNQGIVADDEFNTVQVMDDDKYLSDGVTVGTSLNVEGGVGMDNFTLLHNVGNVSLAGGRGSDTFSVHSFLKKPKSENELPKPVDSGAMSVDGGSGIDTLKVAGTVGDDTVVITKAGMLSNSIAIKVAGVEETNFDAGAGDDMFHVLENNKNETTNINGGFGNDTVSIGGLDEAKDLRSSDTEGQANTVTYEILSKNSNELSEDQRANSKDVESGVVHNDKFIVMDTSEQPVVFYSKNDGYISLDNIKVSEGGTGSFYIGYNGDLKGGTIDVVLTVPMLSSTALQHGDRGILIKLDSQPDDDYSDNVSLTFSGTNPSIVKVSVKVLTDHLFEEAGVYSITAKSIWKSSSNPGGLPVDLTRSVSVISIETETETSGSDKQYENLFTRTDEFNVSGADISLGEIAKNFNGEIYIYQKNKDKELVLGESNDYVINADTGVLTLTNPAAFEKAILFVNYRSGTMRLDGSKLRLVYDNIRLYDDNGNSVIKVEYVAEGTSESVSILSKNEAAQAGNADIYFDLLGDSLVFYNSNGRLASLHGNVTISSKNATFERILEPDGIQKSDNLKASDGALKVEPVNNEKSASYAITEATDAANTATAWNSRSFTVTYDGQIGDGEFVYVKVYATDFNLDENVEDTHLVITCDGKTGSSVIVAFSKNELSKTVTVVAKHDGDKEIYGNTIVPVSPYVISGVEGSVYAYGEGTSISADFSNPDILKYNHKLKNKENEIVEASTLNEKNSYDVNKMGIVSSITDKRTITFNGEHAEEMKFNGTVKFIKNDIESEWFCITGISDDGLSFTVNEDVVGFGEGDVTDVYVLFSGEKDYLFKDEADNTDRIFVNNQQSSKDAYSTLEEFYTEDAEGQKKLIAESLKFTNKDLSLDENDRWDGEIVANHIEYGEYNLGTGKDGVDITKTLYRQDGFQTFTVVNTGKGVDTININSYKDEKDGIVDENNKPIADGQLVVNAEDGNDFINAPGDGVNSSNITKNGMILLGGRGIDTIKVTQGVIAFGDMGNIEYTKPMSETDPDNRKVVTNLGYDENGNTIHTRISKDKDTGLQLQTDGVARGATSIISVQTSDGAHDEITAGGHDSVIVGGADKDSITINGSINVVLGDNGEAKYSTNEHVGATWHDNGTLKKYLKIVQTIDDGVGDVDTIEITGDKNVVMGGHKGDRITIGEENNSQIGKDNIVVGDGGVYTVLENSQTVETKSETLGGHDVIKTGDGKNTILGGTDVDEITTGSGNDIIVGDGGLVIMDLDRNPLIVTNSGKNVDEETTETKSAGGDIIVTSGGDNVIFGGLGNDDITSGNGEDVVFGDNGYATFSGNAGLANNLHQEYKDLKGVFTFENTPVVRDSSTVSFNFQGAAQSGLAESAVVGAEGYATWRWNNIAGSLAGTYGNDDSEVVRFNDGTRASAMSVSYAGIEWHRNTSTDDRINLQAYNLGLHGTSSNADKKFMNTGLMTTAPNAQCLNKFEVSVDGVGQYFSSYEVVVYLDIPDSHSAYGSSVRKVSIYLGNSPFAFASYYVNDSEGNNFDGHYIKATATSADSATYANYVVFTVSAAAAKDKFRVIVEDAYPDAPKNGKNLPGIAGIQIKGDHHKQDVAASTDIKFGGDDVIHSNGGDDIVVGGTGSDEITTFDEDDRHGINDNDVVFGDNAKMLFADRDSNDATASTLTTAESVGVTSETLSGEETDGTGNVRKNKDKYADTIKTGDGNDVVVGGLGADHIESGATAAAESRLDDVKVLSINFTRENANSSAKIQEATYLRWTSNGGTVGVHYEVDGNGNKFALDSNKKRIIATEGEMAGVVADTDWHNMYIKNGELHEMTDYSSHTVDGVDVKISSYAANGWWNEYNAGNYSMTHENSDELDGDTANAKLYDGYFASQQQYEIKLTLDHINQFRSKNGLATGDACDLYIYLGGDNNDTDTYNYVYSISLNNVEYRYLNDWTGHNFDGDYKEATYSHYVEAWSSAHQALRDSAVRVQLEGNYVVFRNFTGDKADIRIKNVLTFGGQSPKNLPVISAVQIVAGAGKDSAAIGGDHDKDLVYGDDAKLWFDLDIPYAADENIANYRNRVIETESVAIDSSVINVVSTDDHIETGKDRDVVVGGEGADTIITGLGDDVALSGNANLMVEHNNPLGVFTPNTEIVLDQHTINTNLLQNYLDNDNANIWQFQSRLNQNQILGIDKNVDNTNDRKGTIDAGEGRNLTHQASSNEQPLVPEEPETPQATHTPPNPDVSGQGQGTGSGQGQETGSGQGQETGSGSGSDSTSETLRQYVLTQREVPTYISVNAGETVEIVLTDWNEGNQYYHPNIVLQLNGVDNQVHSLVFSWDKFVDNNGNVSLVESGPVTVSLQNYQVVDIPDSSNVTGEHKIVLRVYSDEDLVFLASAGSR